tara:strand:+ start:316 stop:435 length:120 start_codon:yes stop_codon:yes gene_type:complete
MIKADKEVKEKKKRLAVALKKNLYRRKNQQRERTTLSKS